MLYCETNLNTMQARAAAIEKTVYIKKNMRNECPDCEYDPINKESKNLACQTCSGSGFVITTKFVKLPAIVHPTPINSEMIEAGVSAVDKIKLLLSARDFRKYRNYLKSQHRVYLDKIDEYEISSIERHGPGREQMYSIFATKVVAPTRGVE
jgi:hypothetical protein